MWMWAALCLKAQGLDSDKVSTQAVSAGWQCEVMITDRIVRHHTERDFTGFISNLLLLAEIGFLSEQGQFNCSKVIW